MEKSLIKDYLQGCRWGLGEKYENEAPRVNVVELLSFLSLNGQGEGGSETWHTQLCRETLLPGSETFGMET